MTLDRLAKLHHKNGRDNVLEIIETELERLFDRLRENLDLLAGSTLPSLSSHATFIHLARTYNQHQP